MVLLVGLVMVGKVNNMLNVVFVVELELLDIYCIVGCEGLIFVWYVYDGLIYKDLNSGEFLLVLVESWICFDFMMIEFMLCQGVKFYDGMNFIVEDVV